MHRQGKMALAALAIASAAWPAPSAAQTREAADAAEALAPADEQAVAADPTWDAVVQAILGELPPESGATPKEATDAEADPADARSDAAVQLTEWVIASGDNGGLPFIVIDKTA